MLLNLIWYSYNADIHTVAVGRILLPATDTRRHHLALSVWIYMRSLDLPGCQLKSVQVRWYWRIWKGLPHASWTNPSHIPASVPLFSDFPPVTRTKYYCFYPRPISSLTLGIPVSSRPLDSAPDICSCPLSPSWIIKFSLHTGSRHQLSPSRAS